MKDGRRRKGSKKEVSVIHLILFFLSLLYPLILLKLSFLHSLEFKKRDRKRNKKDSFATFLPFLWSFLPSVFNFFSPSSSLLTFCVEDTFLPSLPPFLLWTRKSKKLGEGRKTEKRVEQQFILLCLLNFLVSLFRSFQTFPNGPVRWWELKVHTNQNGGGRENRESDTVTNIDCLSSPLKHDGRWREEWMTRTFSLHFYFFLVLHSCFSLLLNQE